MKRGIAILALVLSQCLAYAGNGLDSAFGKNGIATILPSPGYSYHIGEYFDFITLPSGKILAAGLYNNTEVLAGLVRLHCDGRPDSSFGSYGIRSMLHNAEFDRIFSDGRGQYIVAGYQSQSGFGPFIARVDSSGNLDTTFGSNGGYSLANLGGRFGSAALLQDGKILVVGEGSWENILIRYRTNGLIDSSFGQYGIVKTYCGIWGSGGKSVVVQSDGKMVVGGSGYNDSTHTYTFWLARYWPDGRLDSSLNRTGTISIDGGLYAQLYDVALQPDGRILACGRDGGINGYMLDLFRFHPDGTPDTSFNHTGRLEWDFDSMGCTGRSMCLQPDGKIVVGGFGASAATEKNFGICRINSNGSVDRTFGQNGKIITPIGNKESWLNRVTVLPNGKILAAGFFESDLFNYPQFVFARYTASMLPPDTNKPNGNKFLLRASPNPFWNTIELSWTGGIDISIDLALYNSLGQLVRKQKLPQVITDEGSYSITTPESLPGGVYWLRVESNGFKQAFSLTKR